MLRSTFAVGVAAVAALILGAGPALAAGWTSVPAPPTGQDAYINAIAADSSTDAWAVGVVGKAALIDHWNGTAWSQVTTSATSFPSVNARAFVHLLTVGASSPTDAWASGIYSLKPGYQHAFTIRWNGSAWTLFSYSSLGNIDDLSSTDAYSADEDLAQWNGTGWTGLTPPAPPGPDEGDLSTVSASSASNVWAVGTYDPAFTSEIYDNYSVHWNGSAWTEVAMPLPSSSDPLLDYQINSIDAISPTNVWAVGEVGDNVAAFYASGGGGTPQSALIEHYNGTSWSIVANPAGSPTALASVTATSASNVWAVGGSVTENWNGSAWTTVSIPVAGELGSVSTTPGGAIVWAAGSSGTGTATNPLILQNG